MKVYYAGGWFSPEQEEQHTRIYNKVLLGAVYPTDGIHNPRLESLVKPGSSQEELQATFKSNLTSIDDADLLVALTDFNDKGTFIEIGYALAKGIPVLYYAENLKGKPFNLMLAVSGPVAKNEKELFDMIQDPETLKPKLHFYEGEVE